MYLSEVKGKGGITARVVADSINEANVRLITFEIEVHRLIWSEFMTHRVFSRNAASSRAIPVKRVIEMVRDNPAIPISFGKNMPGMQAKEELVGEDLDRAKQIWIAAANDACNRAQQLLNMEVHKQVVNRLLEPFVMMKAVVTMTERDNFYELRLHKDADPHIQELARVMKEAQDSSTPTLLNPNQWHLPYVEVGYDETGSQIFFDDHGHEIDLDRAIKVSASCCAQVSYRKNDPSVEKAEDIYNRLIYSKPVHASPVEHQAMCPEFHDQRKFVRNFRGWVQQRALLNV